MTTRALQIAEGYAVLVFYTIAPDGEESPDPNIKEECAVLKRRVTAHYGPGPHSTGQIIAVAMVECANAIAIDQS